MDALSWLGNGDLNAPVSDKNLRDGKGGIPVCGLEHVILGVVSHDLGDLMSSCSSSVPVSSADRPEMNHP